MITTDEKLKLLEEVGMWAAVSKIKADIEAQNEIKRLTDMKLKLTSEDKIKGMICHRYWSPKEEWKNIGINTAFDVFGFCFLSIITAGILPIVYMLKSFKRGQLASMSLSSWTDRIPTGALYAVKEAKDRGLSDFQIYYPVTERKARIMADPVIVGFYGSKQKSCPGCLYCATYGGLSGHKIGQKGQMVEVFAWDDGKVYE